MGKYNKSCVLYAKGYLPDETTDSDETSKSLTLSPAQIAEKAYVKAMAEIEARQKKVVTTADGKEVKTEIDGRYEVSNLCGTAVTTPKTEVLKAIGLSEEEIKASIYMTDDVKKEDKELMSAVALNNGKKVVGTFISDMYSITKEGKITKLHSSVEPIKLVFGLPKYAIVY